MSQTNKQLITEDGWVDLGAGPMRLEVKNDFVLSYYGTAAPTDYDKEKYHEEVGDVPYPWTDNVYVYNPNPGVPINIVWTTE
jgi:hypothetical protein